MIEINLVPSNLKKKKRKLPGALGKGLNFPKELIIGLIGGFFAVLIIISVLLQITIFLKVGHLKTLRKQWQEITPTKSNVDRITGQLRSLQSKIRSMESVIGMDPIRWAPKLYNISEILPRGVWLSRIVINKQRVVIEGSAMAKGKDEMINVHNFASNLKERELFMKNLSDLEVGSIQRKTIKTIEVADFSITAKIK